MSRCKCCDIPLYGAYEPAPNKYTGQEDDLCTVCAAKSKDTYEDHEYTGGNNPNNGVTRAKDVPYE